MNGLGAICRDLRFSLRSLRRSKAFSLAVIATLALCIGANSTIVTVLYGLVLKPLPLVHPEQVVDVYNTRPKEGPDRHQVGVAQYLDFREHADLFEGFSIWRGWMFNIGEAGGTTRYVGMQVSHEYFSVLGLQPMMGRFFREEENQPGNDKVAVLMPSFWKNNFNADPDIVGKEIRLSGEPHTIIGVAPYRFEELSTAPMLVKPLAWRPEHAQPKWRHARMGALTARIKPGVSHGAALVQLQTLEARHLESLADPGMRDYLQRGGQEMGLIQLRELQVEPIKKGLFLLQGGALLVLVLGCVNVASLMLARANMRRAELSARRESGRAGAAVAHGIDPAHAGGRAAGFGDGVVKFTGDQFLHGNDRLWHAAGVD